MNKFVISFLAGAAFLTASTVVQSASLPDTYEDLRADYPLLNPGFDDEQLYLRVTVKTALDMEADLNLPSHWTGEQYARAKALKDLSTLRDRYSLPPKFTRDEMIGNRAAAELNEFRADHGSLPARFTAQDLLNAEGTKHAVLNSPPLSDGTQPVKPIGAEDYQHLEGEYLATDFAESWGLSANWSFEELRAVAGPERAASLGRQYHIHPFMTHSQIVALLGESELKDHAKFLHLPLDYTANDEVQAWGKWSVKQLREDLFDDHGKDAVDEAWVYSHFKAQLTKYLQLDFPGLNGNFTESQLFNYLVKQADDDMRSKYGLVGSYDENDVAQASAQSYVAELRFKYKLPMHFDENQLRAAMKAEHSKFESTCY